MCNLSADGPTSVVSSKDASSYNGRNHYITGYGRSGTTVAAVLMNLHPDCRMLLESHMALDFLQAFDPGCGRGERYHTKTVWYGAKQTEHYYWGLNHALQEFQEEQVIDPVDATRACIDALWRLWGSPQVFGGKSPMYCVESEREKLLRVFPDARFIVMVRPIEECIESLLARPWGVSRQDAEEHFRRQEQGLKTIQRAFYVELEWLKGNPQQALHTMLLHMGLDPGKYPWERALEIVNGERVS